MRTATTGTVTGGGPILRGHICAILRNPIYTGRIAHRGTLYPGLHPPIISLAEWDEVQVLLTGHRRGVPPW